MTLTILFEDEHLLAVSKPAGLSTQAPPIAGTTLETLVRAYFGDGDPLSAFAGTVHRLDRPVSGVVLWAKTSRDAHLLARQFERRSVTKEYWAVINGEPTPRFGVWEDWLVREDTGLGRVQRCRPGTPRAQHARTRFEVGGQTPSEPGLASLKLWPETGRMHQLRVQTGERGWPIIGDQLYGSRQEFEPNAVALHAACISFLHPRDNRPLVIQAPVPESWLNRGWGELFARAE